MKRKLWLTVILIIIFKDNCKSNALLWYLLFLIEVVSNKKHITNVLEKL